MAGVYGLDEITALLDIEENKFGRWCAVNHLRFRIESHIERMVGMARDTQHRQDKEMVRNGKPL